MTDRLPCVHAVTSDAVLALTDLTHRAHALAAAGVLALHARSGTLGGRRLTELALRLASTGAPVYVNDRADVASIVNAAGVHLPAAGLPVDAVRRIVGPTVLVGRSVHSAEQALSATDEGADYVFLGPIWETTSHPNRVPLGPQVIAAAQPARVVAIGGVTPQRAPLCREQGAYGVAAISALWQARDPGAVAREMLLSFE